jgi:cytochrome c553
MPFSTPKYDDNAVKLGQALPNSKVHSLDLHVTGVTPTRGALALAQGLATASCNLTAISIQGQPSLLFHTHVMQVLLDQGIRCNQYITTLNLVAPIGHVDALCAVLTCPTTPLQCLKLWSSCTNALSEDEMKQLGEALATNTSLQELWIGITTMEGNENSTSLDLEHLFSCLARRTRPLIKLHLRGERSQTTTVTMNEEEENMVVEEEEMNRRIPLLLALQPLLVRTTPPSSSALCELELQNCTFPEEHWNYLAESLASTGLTSLSITNCVLTPKSIQSLSQGLARNKTLHTLRLCRNQLGDAGLQTLLQHGLLQANSSLTTLALINNQMSDVSMTNLAEYLAASATTTTTTSSSSKCCPLQHLDVMHNILGPLGALQLFEVAALHFPRLQTLSVAENAHLTLESMAQWKGHVKCLAQLSVQTLDVSWRPSWQQPQAAATTLPVLSSCSPTSDAPPCSRREAAGQVLVQVLQANYHLQQLVFHETDFSLPLRKQLAFYMYLNKCGRRGLLTHASMHNNMRDIETTTTTTTSSSSTSDAIWSHVLAKCATVHHQENNTNNNDRSVMFYFLQQKPELILGAASMNDDSNNNMQL